MSLESSIKVLTTLSSAQLNAQKITNSILSDVVNSQLTTNNLLRQQISLSRKSISASKFTAQENAIEKYNIGGVGGKDKGGKTKKKSKVDLKKALGLGALALSIGALTAAASKFSDGAAGIADTLDGWADNLEEFEIDLRKKLSNFREKTARFLTRLEDILTPIDGFSMFGLRQISMGVDAAKSGKYAKTGGAVRGAVGKGIARAAKSTAMLPVRGTQAIAEAVGRSDTSKLASKLDDIAIRQGARAGSSTLPTTITPKTLKDSLVAAVKTTRERSAGFVSGARQRAAGFVSGARQGVQRGVEGAQRGVAGLKNLPTQAKLFGQGLTGARDVDVLRTAGRPFPNIARGVGDVGMEAGGVFRAGRGIRTGIQGTVTSARNAASATRQAVSAATPQGLKQFVAVSKAAGPQAAILGTFDDIVKNLKNLKVKTITSFGNVIKTLPGQFKNLTTAVKGFGTTAKTALKNFDLGKAATQVSKLGSRGVQGAARLGAAGARATPGVAAKLGDTIRAARTATPRAVSTIKNAKGIASVAKGASSLAKRIPILGSLISAGFGAMDANTEEMERLRAENPQMDEEQIKAGLADGSLKKDKAKIVGRSAGAGVGAGIGTVAGGILGSALGPIGTALGAAAGAWLGENVGKFLGEGFANTFKSFDWGGTFGPVIDNFKGLAGSIIGALDTVAGVFGITGDGEDGSGGFIKALQNIGRIIGIIAKVLLKTLAPVLNLVISSIRSVVDLVTNIVKTISTVVQAGMGFIKGLIDNVPSWLGGDALRNMVSGMEGAMSGDVIGKINNFVDGTSDEGEGGPVQNSARGKGGGFNMLNPMSWFSGDAQKATTGDLDNVSNDTLAGKLYNRRKQQEEMMKKLRGQGGPSGQGGPTSSSEFIKLSGMGGGTGSRPNITVTSKRGMRSHPISGSWRMHQGTDIAAASGTPMFLPLGAKIVDNRADGNGAGYGNSIYFTTEDGITHMYGHMKYQSRLKVGKTYAAGTKVGEVGNTGQSDGPHLHWETATKEGDVGRSGRSLFEPLSKYNKYAPFTKDGPGTPSLDGSSSSSSSYSADGSTPGRQASAAALSVSPITSALRGMASVASGMSSNIANRSDALQKSGMESGLADSIAGALAPLASIPQLLMSAANSNAGGGTMSPQDPGMQGSGDVSMFPTTSPVRDGGHVFQGDI
jgi:hypothetical protein